MVNIPLFLEFIHVRWLALGFRPSQILEVLRAAARGAGSRIQSQGQRSSTEVEGNGHVFILCWPCFDGCKIKIGKDVAGSGTVVVRLHS